jgi:hypothetical protein
MTNPAKEFDPAIQTFANAIGTAVGAIVYEAAITCLRAWLLGVAVGLLAPSIVLTFWQWITVTIAIRLMISNTISVSK